MDIYIYRMCFTHCVHDVFYTWNSDVDIDADVDVNVGVNIDVDVITLEYPPLRTAVPRCRP